MSRATAVGRARIRLAVIAVATMLTGLFPLVSAHAVDPGKNGSVVFIWYNGFNTKGGIATESSNGAQIKHILIDDAAWAPAWSPNGRLIAYGTTGGVRIIKPDGTHVRSLAPGGAYPTWSRDGSQIAFTIANSIYKQPATGGTITRLTTSPKGCQDQRPRWSPTAPSIVFFRFCSTTPHRLIYTVNTSTKQLQLVTADGIFDPNDRVENPDFLPSGERISLTANCSAPGQCIIGNNHIVTVDLNGGRRIAITNDPSCGPEDDCSPYEGVKASPNGSNYLFEMATNGPMCWFALYGKANYCGNEGPQFDAFQPDWQPLR